LDGRPVSDQAARVRDISESRVQGSLDGMGWAAERLRRKAAELSGGSDVQKAIAETLASEGDAVVREMRRRYQERAEPVISERDLESDWRPKLKAKRKR
jgi:hypothetical protein